MVLQGEIDQVCAPETTRAFVRTTGAARLFSLPGVGHGFGVPAKWQREFLQAYHAIADARPPGDVSRASAPVVADLSLVEVPATGEGHQETIAVILTGDGGWAEIDKSLAAGLAAAGIPAVGWSSLDYYWSPRTPEQASADLARIIEHYTATWKRSRVIVIGYSFGADVAPFLVNRLPISPKARVASVALLGPSNTAAFEFHLASWLGGGGGRQFQTRPEIERLDVPVTCVSGADEADSVCRTARNPRIRAETVGTGHHFGGNYERIVEFLVR
jgi:type IV secretory pathway VirJ component